MRFLIDSRPEQQQQLDRAQDALFQAGWGYSDLRGIPRTEWKEMGIGGGTVKLLKNKMRSWEGPKGSGGSMNGSSGENIQLKVLAIDVFNRMEGLNFKI